MKIIPKVDVENFKNEVLEAFKKQSPSRIIVKSESDFAEYIKLQEVIFDAKLKFPVQMFNGKSVLDFGCGTGEVDLAIAHWGAEIEGFDFNDESLDVARSMAKKSEFEHQLNFFWGDIDTYVPVKTSYDFVISMGVIAHVPDQFGMFSSMARRVTPSGYLILGYVESSGLIKRLLHRAFIKRFNTDKSDESVYQLARKYFSDHIERSIKYGKRTELGIINDYLVNPHYHGLTRSTILAWAEKLGLSLYNAWPPRSVPFRVDGSNHDSFAGKESGANLSGLHDLAWCFAQSTDFEVMSKLGRDLEKIDGIASDFIGEAYTQLQNYDFENLDHFKCQGQRLLDEADKALEIMSRNVIESLSSHVEALVREIEKLGISAENGAPSVPPSQRLYRGYNGLSTSYLIFRKAQ